MALAYLFDPNKQFQDRNGVNNVSGFLRVYYEGTDDRATTYKNFIGTLNPADIPIDNDGRAVVIVDEEKTYRIEVYSRNGNLQWTQHPVFPQGGGGSDKIHRYSFGDGVVDGETPVYGSWLIDLDKPDPNGPEGYARVTPAEFWKSTAVNGEVPVYLQDKNANNSLTYAYLSRTDVTKSGSTVTSVFAYFVRSGYGNELEESVGFRFTKLYNSDYLQRASATDDAFTALESTGDGKDVTVTFSEASERTDIGTGERLSILFGKIKKWFSSLKAVAFSGSYNDLSHTPTIPAAQVQSDWSQSNSSAVDYIKNKPSLASVATSGSYNDLLDKPTIGAVMSHQSSQSVDHTVTSSEASSGNIRIPLSHYDRGEYLLNIQLYAASGSHFGSTHVPLRVSFRYMFDGSDAWSQEYTGALERLDPSGPWYYGSTIRLNTDMAWLTGIEVELYFGANNLVRNDTIGVKINYLLLSEPS